MRVMPSDKFKTLVNLYQDKSVLAEKLGTDATVISRIMAGERGVPASIIAAAIAFTGFTYEELFTQEEE